MNIFYEQETFERSQVPIRVFIHTYTDGHIFTPIHWHRSLELNLMVEGEVMHRVGGTEYFCEPDDICIVNSGELHANHSTERCPRIRMITVQISMLLLKDWFKETVYFHIPKDSKQRDEMRELLIKIGQESLDQSQYHALHQMTLTFQLLDLMSRNCTERAKEKEAQREGEQHFRKVLDFIEEHYREELSLEVLAKQFSYSSTYLSRSFKRKIGYNFIKHVQMVRMNATLIDMRRNPEKTIINCATDNGFPNVKSFIQIFREEYGCTPSEWRRETGQHSYDSQVVLVDSVPAQYDSLYRAYMDL